MKEIDIRQTTIDGMAKTAIRLSDKDAQIPTHMLQGEKMKGVLFKDGEAHDWYYDGLTQIDGGRYFYFDTLELSCLDTLFTTHRSHALEIVRNIALALESTSPTFTSLETGIFPLRRIYISGEQDVLLLPPDIGDLMSVYMSDQERQEDVNILIKGSVESGYTLIMEMAELLYYAATGFFPFEDENTRRNKYREYPIENALGALDETLDEKTQGFINVCLHAKTQQMRDIMGNRSPEKALKWFIQHSLTLNWDLKDRNSLQERNKITESLEYMDWETKTARNAARANFWRKKGTPIIISAVAAIVVIWILTDYLKNILAPPTTKDMDQEEIVAAFYAAQNELNATELTTAVKGAKIPQENEVTNLFVSSRVREAYEMQSPIVNAKEWVEEGKPAIEAGRSIYGVSDYALERIDEDTIYATFTLYTPYPYGDMGEEEVSEDDLNVYAYRYTITQSFDFTWNDRGWWNITGSEFMDIVYEGREIVQTFQKEASM